MSQSFSQDQLIASLPDLKSRLLDTVSLRQIATRACAVNPWFTPPFVFQAISGIADWLDPKLVQGFLSPYPPAYNPGRQVGLITAGNVPLVGFHDLLMILLAGHQAILKPAHQDRPLTEWVVANWKEVLPQIEGHLQLVDQLPGVDFLLATGSNNTARYFETLQPGIPRLIRRNRFSVAVIEHPLSQQACQGLLADILLYNGLGCRNVSHLLVKKGVDLLRFEKALEEYPAGNVNPLFLEKVVQEQIKSEMLDQTVRRVGPILFKTVSSPGPLPMGYLGIISDLEDPQIEVLLTENKDQLQVVVGREAGFGEAQQPGLADFADGVDTLAVLLAL